MRVSLRVDPEGRARLDQHRAHRIMLALQREGATPEEVAELSPLGWLLAGSLAELQSPPSGDVKRIVLAEYRLEDEAVSA
jgi:hypothetical protein